VRSSNKPAPLPNSNMVNAKASEEIRTANQAPPETNSAGKYQILLVL